MRWLTFVLLLLLAVPAKADIRVNLITRLNQIVDDPLGDRKMSQANKVAILNQVGREYGRRGLIVNRDTIITEDSTEMYPSNSDFAGSLQSAYWKEGFFRKGLRIVARDSAFTLPRDEDDPALKYIYVDQDGQIGFEPIPQRVDTVILLYYAHAATLTNDSVEWEIPDAYEDAALYDAAQRIHFKIGTAESQAKAQEAGRISDSLLGELMLPMPQARKTGVTVR